MRSSSSISSCLAVDETLARYVMLDAAKPMPANSALASTSTDSMAIPSLADSRWRSLQYQVASASIRNSPPLTPDPLPEALSGTESDCPELPVDTTTSWCDAVFRTVAEIFT